MRKIACLSLLLAAASSPRAVHAQVDARLLRYPDVSATHISFAYGGDIWVVPKTGGVAQRLSSPKGEESFPRFSPDGSRIAFTGNYNGNNDIYVMPAAGGEPTRVTHHPSTDRVIDWYPDGRSLLFATSMSSEKDRFNKLYRVNVSGGLPQPLPMPYGEFGALSSDARTIAYTPNTLDFRTWKRYRGGLTSDIWLYDLDNNSARKISDPTADDTQPMWHGSTLYYLSDRGDNLRHNLWALDTKTNQHRQITNYSEWDVRFPSIGPNDIVFENGGRLYTLALGQANAQPREVKVQVYTDLAALQPQAVKVGTRVLNAGISPTAKRAIFESRGEIISVPAEFGMPRLHTQRSSTAERYPAWSPDGKSIAYWSDKTGEYELTLRNADGSGEERTVTKLGPGFRYAIHWSPDSKTVGFMDQTMSINLVDVASGNVKKIDRAWYYHEGGRANFRMRWSPDSRYVTFARDMESRASVVMVYDNKENKLHQVTSGFYPASSPTFDPEGKYLYFLTNRSFTPTYSDFDNTWIYANSSVFAALPLTKSIQSPLYPRNDDEPVTGAGAETAAKGIPQVVIDFDDAERRIVILPMKAGNYGELEAVPGKLLFHRHVRTGANDEKNAVVYYDLKERKEEVVIDDAQTFMPSFDNKKLLLVHRGALAITDIKPGVKMDKPLATANVEVTVTPREEWKQIFNDAWRFQRDMFYARNLHGVDWELMRKQYGSMVDDAISRDDVNFILGELIAELNTSHTYRSGGDVEQPLQRGVGLLGADYELSNGAYRIKRIVDGGAWDSEVRSPLRGSGLNINEGDYILAVNGNPIDTSRDPFAAFQGLANTTIALTVNSAPSMSGARTVLIETLTPQQEARLRNLAWIEAKRAYVEKKTDGKVGYIFVPSTGIDGQNELFRMFAGQWTKDALIVDERFNNGGQIPDRFVELLARPRYNYWGVRDGADWAWPPGAHEGPKVMLVNEWSGSGGDAFPFYFKEAKLGPIVGKRTWGGLVGISGSPALVDGGSVTVPTFGIYNKQGEWIIENEGVRPDVEVDDDPSKMVNGGDPQLDKAIELALQQLKTNPPLKPKRPADPDRAHPKVKKNTISDN
jgi:tricorn protease